MRDCKNFKIRINAALSLSVPPSRNCYGDSYYHILKEIVASLEGIDDITDFAEYKYKETLEYQVRIANRFRMQGQ